MGCYLGILAFKAAPDIGALDRLGWIKGYRLYQKTGGREWYLEGPDTYEGGISFFSLLRTSLWWKLGGSDAAAKEVIRLRAAINAVSDDTQALDHRFLMHALQLSADLKTDVLAGFGDDENMDGGIVCSGGRVTGGRMQTEGNKCVVFDAKGVRAVESRDDSEGLMIYGMLGEAATQFFGHGEPVYISSDPYDFDSADYALVASRG